jgi:hypothetical protein
MRIVDGQHPDDGNWIAEPLIALKSTADGLVIAVLRLGSMEVEDDGTETFTPSVAGTVRHTTLLKMLGVLSKQIVEMEQAGISMETVTTDEEDDE